MKSTSKTRDSDQGGMSHMFWGPPFCRWNTEFGTPGHLPRMDLLIRDSHLRDMSCGAGPDLPNSTCRFCFSLLRHYKRLIVSLQLSAWARSCYTVSPNTGAGRERRKIEGCLHLQ